MFSDPKKNIEQMQLEHGMKIADLGSGSGFYSLEAARVVGDGGKVYAIDVYDTSAVSYLHVETRSVVTVRSTSVVPTG